MGSCVGGVTLTWNEMRLTHDLIRLDGWRNEKDEMRKRKRKRERAHKEKQQKIIKGMSADVSSAHREEEEEGQETRWVGLLRMCVCVCNVCLPLSVCS